MENKPGLLRLLRPLFISLGLVFVSFHLGAFDTSGRDSANRFFVEVGALGFLCLELAVFMVQDYYVYRGHRGDGSKPFTFSDGLEPPMLALKVGGSFFLFAFLCAVVVTLSIYERGWGLMSIAFFAALTGWIWGAPPFFARKTLWGNLLRAFSVSFLPFFCGAYLTSRWPSLSGWVLIFPLLAFSLFHFLRISNPR